MGYQTPKHPQVNQAGVSTVIGTYRGFSRAATFRCPMHWHLWPAETTVSFRLEETFWNHLVQPLCSGRVSWSRLSRTISRQVKVFETSAREGKYTLRGLMNLSEVHARDQERCFIAPEPILDVSVWASESHPLCLLEHVPCNSSCMLGSSVGID